MASPQPVQLTGFAPYFPVPDVAPAIEYYERVLGFVREYVAGDPPQFAIVSRDGLRIMFRRVTDAAKISPNENQGGTWDVFFWVQDLKPLYAELVGRGAQIVYGPILQPSYHMEEFAIRDSNGYVLGFGQPV